MKKIIIIIMSIVVMGIFSSCVKDKNIEITKEATIEITKSPELIKISANDLSSAYKTNEIKADQLYKNKKVELTGTIYSLGEMLGSMSISLNGSDPFNTISCSMIEDQRDKMATLEKDQEIVIIGIVNGYGLNTELTKCIIK